MSECDTSDPGVRGFLKVVELEMRRVLLLKLKLKGGARGQGAITCGWWGRGVFSRGKMLRLRMSGTSKGHHTTPETNDRQKG